MRGKPEHPQTDGLLRVIMLGPLLALILNPRRDEPASLRFILVRVLLTLAAAAIIIVVAGPVEHLINAH